MNNFYGERYVMMMPVVCDALSLENHSHRPLSLY